MIVKEGPGFVKEKTEKKRISSFLPFYIENLDFSAILLHIRRQFLEIPRSLYHIPSAWYNKPTNVGKPSLALPDDPASPPGQATKGGLSLYRYSSQSRFNYVMRSHRGRQIFIILAVLLAIFVIIKLSAGSGLDAGNFENQRNAKLRSEMQHALSQTSSLSSLGATNTSGVLGKIRQYIHGMEVLNDLNVGMYGEVGRLYAQSVFDNIYSVIDAFDAKLASGQKVNDSLAALRQAMDELTLLTNTVLDH